jgi:hypothetical protein
MWLLAIIGVGIVALAHTAPTRFLLDAMAGHRAVWSMPRGAPPTIYLTYDDGPNPTTTPDLLDVLAREGVHAQADRLPAGWLGLDAVGLQLVAPAHSGQHFPADLETRFRRRHHRHARW